MAMRVVGASRARCTTGFQPPRCGVACISLKALCLTQVILPNGEPLQLKMGLHCGEAYTGMLGTSPPHFQCALSPPPIASLGAADYQA